jgi:biotin carboxyl carrier protein
MPRKYLIKVNNKAYEVEVTEVGQKPAVTPEPIAALAAQRPATVSIPQVTTAPPSRPLGAVVDGQKVIPAPMTGTIIKILCSEGQEINEGDTVLKLEAMKMETDLAAPFAGRIKSILVGQKQNVTAGEPLIVME